jgi:hypothetical protein
MLASRHNSHIFDEGLYEGHCSGELHGRRRGIRTQMPRSCVLVHGLHSSGKSTLLNALLGQHYFPYFRRKIDLPPGAGQDEVEEQQQVQQNIDRKTISIFDVRDRPSVSWTDIPVNILLHKDRIAAAANSSSAGGSSDHIGGEKILAFSIPPFLAQATQASSACTVNLKLWRDSFAPNCDDAPLPAAPLNIPFTLSSSVEDRLGSQKATGDDFVFVMNDNDGNEDESNSGVGGRGGVSSVGIEERHAAQSGAIVDAIENTVGRMLRVPHFVTVDCKSITTNLEPEEPVQSSAHLCKFKSLKIRSVIIDDVMQDPEKPQKDAALDFETKSLRDTREILKSVSLKDAFQYVEDHPHPKLWSLLAESALEDLDFTVAEKAVVRCKEYPAIQFVKPSSPAHPSRV